MILIGRGLDLKEQFRLVVGSFRSNGAAPQIFDLSRRQSQSDFQTEGLKPFPVQFSRCDERKAEKQNSKSHRISGDYSLRVPPVPIPNTEVKPQHADSTWLETAREGRSSPDSIRTFVRMSFFYTKT